MRFGLVGPTYPHKGGVAQHTTELAHRLAAAGHDVTLESWKSQYPALLYPGQRTIFEPEISPFPNTNRELSWRRPDGWLRAGRRLRDEADVVVLTLLTPVQVPSYLAIERACHPVRAIALCHNVFPHERRPPDQWLVGALLRRVDGVLVHSPAELHLAASLTAAPVRKAALPPHFPLTRSRRPFPDEPYRRLLFFGMVRPYKGVDVLLHALVRGPDTVSLVIAGEFWGELNRVRTIVADLGLRNRVDIRPGYVPASQVPALFDDVDALVLPYRSATASQNVWLAHAAGVPVIATRVGSLADHVRHGVDGLVCEPDSVDDLARAIVRFYEPGEPRRLREGVRPVDPEPFWATYLNHLVSLSQGEVA